jgi:hypothetical protein
LNVAIFIGMQAPHDRAADLDRAHREDRCLHATAVTVIATDATINEILANKTRIMVEWRGFFRPNAIDARHLS